MSPAETPARYRQIADEIRARIESGELPAGWTFRGETALAEQYGVARGTIAKAFDALRAEGLVETITGRGTQVRARRAPRRLAHDRYLTGWGDIIATCARARVAATADLADALGVDEGEVLLEQTMMHERDGRPQRITVSRIPIPRITATDLSKGDALWAEPFDQLAAAGVHVDEIFEMPSCRSATEEEARALQLPAGAAVMAIARRMLAGGLPVEAADIVVPAGEVQPAYRITL
ncbi:GntR family transcriptional regulator [Micromonospora maritima]|uniref:GntR family transcriptional regulator n=1 Tax=Micromonospora maritima TaxID=986711 RepID=UPI00157DA673|nr:GntR family transcriptional regulator [Micromonospora maritima]